MVPRVARWFLRLSEFDFQLVHRDGHNMRHVDAMSRAPGSYVQGIEDVGGKILQISNADWVSSLQSQDEAIKLKMNVLNGLQQSDQSKQLRNEYCIKNNRLYKRMDNNLQVLVVPKGIRWRVVQMSHDDMGHPGVDGTMKRITQHFWFPKMRNFVKGFIQSCIECSYHREPTKKGCELHGMNIPKLPFHTLHLDHLGPFVKSRQRNEYVLVVVDALTRYSVIIPTKSTKSKPVIDALNHLTLYFGLPQVMVTDRGTAFTSAMFETYCQDNDIQHIKVAVRTPRANGLAERINQSVLRYLKTAIDDQKDWDKQLRSLQWNLNTKVNATTKAAPIDLIYDFPMRDISGNKLLMAVHDDVTTEMNKRREDAIINIEKAREKWKARFDAKHAKPIKYEVDDLVLIKTPVPSTGESRKLQPVYRGPYVIKRVLRFDRYVVEDVDGMQRSNRHFSTIAASDSLKPWCVLYPELDDEVDDGKEDDEYEA